MEIKSFEGFEADVAYSSGTSDLKPGPIGEHRRPVGRNSKRVPVGSVYLLVPGRKKFVLLFYLHGLYWRIKDGKEDLT